MVAAIVKELAGKGAMGNLVKYLAGIFMALTILSPLIRLELPDLTGWMTTFQTEGHEAAAAGAEMAEEASRELIKARLEAYILDKAASLRAEISADVTLDDRGIPVGVTLYGRITPAAKAEMTRILREELGIGEEEQRWIE